MRLTLIILTLKLNLHCRPPRRGTEPREQLQQGAGSSVGLCGQVECNYLIREVQKSSITSLAGIARRLEASGVKTPAGYVQWQPAQVSRLLQKQDYITG